MLKFLGIITPEGVAVSINIYKIQSIEIRNGGKVYILLNGCQYEATESFETICSRLNHAVEDPAPFGIYER